MAKSREEILCRNEDCPLLAAVVLPLKVHGETVGTLKLYFHDPASLTEVQQQLAEGLAKLFSTQLEHADAEEQLKLLKDAEIKALQAQIHPHFLFNSINTISVLCRTQPEKARELLQELSHFFRSNLQGARNLVIPLEKEIEHVKAYLSLEQARFPDRYEVSWEVERDLKQGSCPRLSSQPLVENSIRHAFTAEGEGGGPREDHDRGERPPHKGLGQREWDSRRKAHDPRERNRPVQARDRDGAREHKGKVGWHSTVTAHDLPSRVK